MKINSAPGFIQKWQDEIQGHLGNFQRQILMQIKIQVRSSSRATHMRTFKN